jgi:hypothetical protein
MKTHMHRLRKKALAFTAIAACSLFYTTSCQKYEEPTAEQLEDAELVDYALQVIPDIHVELADAIDLLNIMDTIPVETTVNGQNITSYKSALHFGDNPPNLFKVEDNKNIGFSGTPIVRLLYLPSDPNYEWTMTTGQPMPYTEYLRITDQHRGVAKLDYKRVYMDITYGDIHQYYIEYANVDQVFIMGEYPYFTIYFTQKRIKENSADPNNDSDYGSNEYVVISGELTSTGIKDYYFGMKIKQYDLPGFEGNGYNVNDIDLVHIDFLPFTYWDPSEHFNN